MLKAIILDDEVNCRSLLEGYLIEYCPQVQILASVENTLEAQKAILQFQPQVAFLDIELQGETSFNLLEQFSKIPFEIIFTTAHENYMLRAIKLSAVDYILKPVNPEELTTAVAKVQQRIDDKALNGGLEILMQNLKGNQTEHQIAIATSDGYQMVKVSNIIYLNADGSYTEFILKNKEHILASKNIKEFENLLEGHGFFRIHKQSMVNMAEVTKYVRGEGGNVVMSNGKSIDVSRRRKEEFLQLLHK